MALALGFNPKSAIVTDALIALMTICSSKLLGGYFPQYLNQQLYW